MTKYSDFLFARPSFIEGLVRPLDPLGLLNSYNESDDDLQADNRALWSDWAAIAADLSQAARKLNNELSEAR